MALFLKEHTSHRAGVGRVESEQIKEKSSHVTSQDWCGLDSDVKKQKYISLGWCKLNRTGYVVVSVGTAAFSRKTVLWKINRQSHKTLPSAKVNLTIASALLEATPPSTPSCSLCALSEMSPLT